MKPIKKIQTENLDKLYDYINLKIVGFINEEENWIANLGNITAILNYLLADLNWVGFYLARKDYLILGPFQGKVACTKIKIGQGVCGSAFQNSQTQKVDDVSSFLGHIPCDEDTKSEIVIPIKYKDIVVGVLDIDSPILNRFSEEDQRGLEKIVATIEKYLVFDEILNVI